jgi:hypothetical protein
LADTITAQGIGGARSGRASGGTPAKPGFLRSKKCAQTVFIIEKIFIGKKVVRLWRECGDRLHETGDFRYD